MSRSMWSAVAGIKSHQEAMDVIGNNISNINTVGFKAGTASFVNVLSDTLSGATSPDSSKGIGGRNPVQIGLGDTVATVSTSFSQGSIQSTNKTTDLALQGDGFFISSDDGGKSYLYSRNGELSFDASGNFEDPSGAIIQGWYADSNHKIDTASSIKGIKIPQNLTVPAGVTKNITMAGNLNGGDTISEMSPAEGASDVNGNPVAHPDDVGVLFNSTGDSIGIGRSTNIAKLAAGTDAISGAYDINDNKIALETPANGGKLTFAVNDSGTTYTYDSSTGTPLDLSTATYGDLVTNINNSAKWTVTSGTGTVAALLTDFNASFNTNGNGELIFDNTSTANDVTISNITTTGDTGSYLKNDLLNLQGGSSSTATIAVGKTRTSLPFLSQKGDVLALSYDNGDNYNGYTYTDNSASGNSFNTLKDLASEIQINLNTTAGWGTGNTAKVDPSTGTIQITNNSSSNKNIGAVYSNNINFATIMGTLSGIVAKGQSTATQPFMAATHKNSIDVYDSLGNKQTVTFTFRKERYDTSTQESTWRWTASAPAPAVITNDSGTLRFDNTGKLVAVSSPLAITADWNNGTANQSINLNYGTIGGTEGITQFSLPSATNSQTQDGFAGGSLERTLINQDGVIVGIFSNGKSYPLAQVALARFANNEGLEKSGGSHYKETANSGTAAVGTAGSGGRATIAPSHLEQSNVDMAEEFTKMLVIERGFQANARTITTSDNMTQQLLGLIR